MGASGGSEIDGFRVVERIAVGGMAEVFLATEKRAVGEPRQVVIKRMLPEVAQERGAIDLFRQEVALGGIIQHPNVIEVVGSGSDGGRPYMVLEYIPGSDLWRFTRVLTAESSLMPAQVALYVIDQLLAGLGAVHGARSADGTPLQIVHRDLSPSNVLLSVYGEVKLADFGIARVAGAVRSVKPQETKGKLGYLSPEQVADAPTDHRSDIFAAGVVAAELLMGRPLFAGGSELAILLAVRDGNIQPFLQFMHSLPTGLGETIVQALARNPEDRFSSALEFRSALRGFLIEPADVLQRRLAAMVARTLERPSLISDETPRQPTDEDVATPRAAPTTESTSPVPKLRYVLRVTGTAPVTGLTYAQLVERISLGKVGPNDRASLDGGPFRVVAEIPNLARHLPPSSSLTTNRRKRDSGTAPISAAAIPLGRCGIATALCRAALRKETGLWLCEHNDIRKELYVRDGQPEFVTSNLNSELLGEHLVAKRVITRGELDMALAVMPRFEGRLGDTLSALGLVEPTELFRQITEQVRDKLIDLFGWRDGTASFYPNVAPPPSGFPLDLNVWRILTRGLTEHVESGRADKRFADWETTRVIQVRPAPAGLKNAELDANAKAILAALEYPRSMNDVLRVLASASSRNGARVVILKLYHLGAVEIEDG